jgi:ABC-type polysaccharide/polyol phosphate export permease
MFIQTARIFAHCMHRELRTYQPQLKKLLINNTVLLPIILTLSVAYLQARSFFGANAQAMSTLIFSGNIIIPLMTTAFAIMFNLFFDLQGPKYITYQMTILSPRLVLLQRLLFGWMLAFILTAPFYPIGKLLLGSKLDTTHTNWLAVLSMVLASTLFCTSYHLLAAIYITNPASINTFWARVNGPMLSLGGLFIPLFTMQQFSTTFGTLIYLNPAIYVTEGLRQAIIGGNQFLPLHLCILVLTTCSVTCFLLSMRLFKKRLDHI